MLEEIQKFSNSEVFTITLENEPEKTRHWFRATDLCEVLFDQKNAFRYVKQYCKDWQYREFQIGKGRPALYVCESGVYRLILRSKAPIAVEFQDWLSEDVLPKLRSLGLATAKRSGESQAKYDYRASVLLAENERLIERVSTLEEVVSFSGKELDRLKGENSYLLSASLAKCF